MKKLMAIVLGIVLGASLVYAEPAKPAVAADNSAAVSATAKPAVKAMKKHAKRPSKKMEKPAENVSK